MAQTKINSQLNVTQTATFEGSVSIGGSANVTGTATFNEQFAIVATDDTVSIVATGVSITASTTITGSVCIYGDSKIEGTVTITGDTGITGTVTVTGAFTCNTLQLQSPSDRLTQLLTTLTQINFGSIAGGAVGTQNVIVTGALLSSFNVVVVDTPDILDDAFLVDGVVTSDDTVSLKLHNTSNGTANAITATFAITVLQFT